MTKELNFNKDDIDRENQAFYEWNEQVKMDSKTWYGYFFKGDNTVYVAITTGSEEHVLPYPNMNFDEAKRRVKLRYFYHNLDGTEHRGFAKDMIEHCRFMAEEKWRKDTGRVMPITKGAER